MIFKKILKIVLCLFILASCTKKKEIAFLEKGTVIITGKVNNLSKSSKTIRFAAGSTVESIEETALIDSLGNFKLEIELYHPQDIQGYFKKGCIRLFLRPDAHIHLTINEKDFTEELFPTYNIEGTHPDVDISKAIHKYLHYCGEYSFSPDAKGKTIKEFHNNLQAETIRQDSILKSFCKSTKVPDDFKIWAQKDTKYSVANYLLTFKFAHKNIKGDLFDESLFPINDDNAIIASNYPLHLRHSALNLGFWQDSITLDLLKKEEYVDAYQRCMNTITNNVEKGLSRDIMCYKLLVGLFDDSFDDYKVVSKNVDMYIENEVLKTVLIDKEINYIEQKKLNVSYLDPKSNEEKEIVGDFWKELKQKYKGQVIYVDIWATWCALCRGEIPHSIELQEHFEGKEIAFVNLCLASNKNEWKKLIKNSNVEGDNYFFNLPQTELLRNKLKFIGYPTYMIIDKQGNLVDCNAPRPSSKETIKIILNKWIKKTLHNTTYM